MAKSKPKAKPTKKAKKKQRPDPEMLRLEYRPLESLALWEGNPKEHALLDLEESLARFGYTDPITLNERDGRVIGGHGRIEALKERKGSGQPPPQRVLIDEKTGDWLVPVVLGIELSEVEHEALGLAENEMTRLAGWNPEKLQAALAHIEKEEGLSGTGFSTKDIDPDAIHADGEDKPRPDDRIPEMELAPFEHWDYVVLMFRDARDFVRAAEMFDLKRVNYSALEDHPKIGVGRIVDGTRLFDLVDGDDDGS